MKKIYNMLSIFRKKIELYMNRKLGFFLKQIKNISEIRMLNFSATESYELLKKYIFCQQRV